MVIKYSSEKKFSILLHFNVKFLYFYDINISDSFHGHFFKEIFNKYTETVEISRRIERRLR